MTKLWHKLGGEQHQAGIVGWLTGMPQAGAGTYPKGPSIDQVLAKTLSAGKKSPSLQMAVRWATGKSNSKLDPINAVNFADTAEKLPLPPQLDPQKIFTTLFGTPGADTSGQTAAIARNKSILDFVGGRYSELSKRLGARDKARLEEHLTQIRGFEDGLDKTVKVGGACQPPAAVDTTGYNPTLGTTMSMTTDAAIPKAGTFMMDMMVMALACEITAVGSFQWTDTEAKHTFPWLNLPEHHHFYQHDGGFKAAECEKICIWYSQMHLHLLQQMDGVVMGTDGHTLLDESVVFFGSEISQPPTHSNNDMPFMLAGGGGGLRGGRWVRYTDKSNNKNSHNNLLVSILNMFGDPRTTYGNKNYCAGPLANLT
jgi:Protein of unknown function (DUF1552)